MGGLVNLVILGIGSFPRLDSTDNSGVAGASAFCSSSPSLRLTFHDLGQLRCVNVQVQVEDLLSQVWGGWELNLLVNSNFWGFLRPAPVLLDPFCIGLSSTTTSTSVSFGV